jgi:hypothetical protein
MPIYINKNNQQSGPYEDHVVIEQLRGGYLSPNDLGIRHGETTWRRLGDLFPEAAARPAERTAPTPSAMPRPMAAQMASTPPKAAGGCRKPLGWTILGFGLLLMLGGALAFVGTFAVYSSISCDLAEIDNKKIDELAKKYEAAKGSDEEIEIEIELKREIAGAEQSNKYCADEKATKRMFQIGSIAVVLVGFIMLITGFFIRRV